MRLLKLSFCVIMLCSNIFAQSLPDNIFLYLPFNGDTKDSSGNNLNTHPYNVELTEGRYGKINNACKFSKSWNSKVSASNTIWDSDFTISFWFKADVSNDGSAGYLIRPNGRSAYLSFRNNGNGEGEFLYYEGRIDFDSEDYEIKRTLKLDQWYHIVLLYNDWVESALYINGFFSGKFNNPYPVKVNYGSGSTSGFNIGVNFGGCIDDVVVYRRILDEPSIQKLYNHNRPKKYTITPQLNNSNWGSITPDTTVTVEEGTDFQFVIEANPGSRIKDVKIDDISTDSTGSYTFTNLSADHTIYAEFESDEVKIIAGSNEGGTITPAGETIIPYGTNKTYNIEPEIHHHIKDVRIGGSGAVGGTSQGNITSYEFVNLTNDASIYAEFERNPGIYKAVFNTDSNGIITPSADRYLTSSDSVTLYAKGNLGYAFEKFDYSDGRVSYDNPMKLKNLASDVTITASFLAKDYTINTDIIRQNSVNVSPSASEIVPANGNTEIILTTVEGYEFEKVECYDVDDNLLWTNYPGQSAKLTTTRMEILFHLVDKDQTMKVFTNIANFNPLIHGMTAYYPFNGNANDESGNNKNGIVHGSSLTADRNANPNSAFYFDGIDDYIELPSGVVTQGKNYSFSLWVKPEDNTKDGARIFCPAADFDIALQHYTSIKKFRFRNYNSVESENNSAIKSNWYHVVVTHDYDNNVKMYVNNVLADSKVLNEAYGSIHLNTIGSWKHYQSSNFKGIIDDIRVYDLTLKEGDVQTLFEEAGPLRHTVSSSVNNPSRGTVNSTGTTVNFGESVSFTFLPLENYLIDRIEFLDASNNVLAVQRPDGTTDKTEQRFVATYAGVNQNIQVKGYFKYYNPYNLPETVVSYYPFAGDANDYGGGFRNGIVNGAVLIEDRYGNADNAYFFDGTDDYIELPDTIIEDENRFALSMWICPEGDKFTDNSYHNYALCLHKNTNIDIRYYDSKHAWPNSIYFGGCNSQNNAIRQKKWHHIVITRDYDYEYLFINGEQVFVHENRKLTSESIHSNKIGANNNPAYSGMYNFYGKIDDIKVFNKRLEASEVANLYNEEKAPPRYYNINPLVNIENAGTITPSEPSTLLEDSNIQFTASANEKFVFQHFQLDNGDKFNQNPVLFELVNEDINITAVFKQIKFDVVSNSDTNGTITPSVNEVVDSGATRIFTAVPKIGFDFSHFSLEDGTEITQNPYTFENINKDISIKAVFKVRPATVFTITPSVEGNGTITPDAPFGVDSSLSREVSAEPGFGFTFDHFLIDGTEKIFDNPYIIPNVLSDKSVKAVFKEKNKFNIELTNYSMYDAEIIPSTGITEVYEGEDLTYQINCKTGHYIKQIIINDSEAITFDNEYVSNYDYTFKNVTTDNKIQVAFKNKHIFDDYETLVGFWPFDNDTDDHSGKNQPTTIGTASLVPGIVGNSYNVNDGSFIIDNQNLNDLEGFTFCFFYKYNNSSYISTDIYKEMVEFENYGSVGIKKLAHSTGTIHFYSILQNLNESEEDHFGHAWLFLSLSGNKNNREVNVYRDGKLIYHNFYQNPVPMTNLGIHDMKIKSFDGQLDDIRIYNRQLGTNEIETLASQGSQLKVNAYVSTERKGADIVDQGTIFPSGEQFVAYGESIEFTHLPKPGYELEYFLVSPSSTKYFEDTLKIPAVLTDMQVLADFKPIEFKIFTEVNNPEWGRIDCSGLPDECPVINHKDAFNDNFRNFYIYPLTGYRVLDLKIRKESETEWTHYGREKDFTISDATENVYVQVDFEPEPLVRYTITTELDDSTKGRTLMPGNLEVGENGDAQVVIMANIPNYHIKEVHVMNGDGSPIEVIVPDNTGTNYKSSVTFNVTGIQQSYKLKAYFKDAEYFITPINHHPERGTITPGEKVVVGPVNSTTFNIKPNEGYHIDTVKTFVMDTVLATWHVPEDKYNFDYTFTNISADFLIVPYFKSGKPLYNIYVHTSGHGDLDPAGKNEVYEGENFTVTAIPYAGDHFKYFILNGQDTIHTNPYTISNVQSNHQISARFGSGMLITPSALTGGSINPAVPTSVQTGSSLTVTATPDLGFEFDYFLINETDTVKQNPYTISNITKSGNVKAVFKSINLIAPFDISLDNATPFQLEISFSEVTGAEKYFVSVASAADSLFENKTPEGILENVFTITDLEPDQEYLVKIKSKNIYEESEFSDIQTFKTENLVKISSLKVVYDEGLTRDYIQVSYTTKNTGKHTIYINGKKDYDHIIHNIDQGYANSIYDYSNGMKTVKVETDYNGKSYFEEKSIDVTWNKPSVKFISAIRNIDNSSKFDISYKVSQDVNLRLNIDNQEVYSDSLAVGSHTTIIDMPTGKDWNLDIAVSNTNGDSTVSQMVSNDGTYYKLQVSNGQGGNTEFLDNNSDILVARDSTTQVIKITPDIGYEVWYMDINGVETELDSTVYTLKNVNENKNIWVFFRKNNWEEGIQKKTYTAGKVLIGTETVHPDYSLLVDSKIKMKEVRVETGWSDYVFEEDYELISLSELAEYIQKKKHLPEIPDSEEATSEGISGGNMSSKLLAKIEELTLHIIQNQKRIKANRLMLEAVKIK